MDFHKCGFQQNHKASYGVEFKNKIRMK